MLNDKPFLGTRNLALYQCLDFLSDGWYCTCTVNRVLTCLRGLGHRSRLVRPYHATRSSGRARGQLVPGGGGVLQRVPVDTRGDAAGAPSV